MALSFDDVLRQMEEAGVGGLAACDLLVDGRYHRFKPEGERKKKKSGWYKFFSITTKSGREAIVGAYGRGADTYKVRPAQTEWTLEEREEFKRRHAERQREVDKERATEGDQAAARAQKLWDKFKDRIGAAPYLRKKNVKPFGVRFAPRGALMIPVRNAAGEMRAIQWIDEDGSTKRFTTGAQIAGNFHLIGEPKDDEWLAIGEGYATLASVHMATGLPCVIAFDAGNLAQVASVFRELYPSAKLLIIGDDDRHLLRRLDAWLAKAGVNERPPQNGEWHLYATVDGPVSVRAKWGINLQSVPFLEYECKQGDKSTAILIENAGRTKAILAARKVKGEVVFPAFANAEESAGTDFNDLHNEQGLDEVKKQIEVVRTAPPSREGNAARKQRAYSNPEFQQMLDHVVLIYPTMTVWDGRSKQIAKIEAVRLRAKWLTDEWLGHPHRKMILDKNLVFDPTNNCDLTECVNLFDGLPLKPNPTKPCDLIVEHIRQICKRDEGLFDWVCKWLAYPLRYPGAKMRTALIVHGGMEGSGKSMVFEVMRRIYGRYAKKVTARQLKSEFTGWMSQMLFCVAEEVTTQQDKYEHAGILRNMITDPVMLINEKQMPLREEENFANFVFLANALMPLVLQEHDRRYTVIYYNEEHDAKYFTRLGDQIDDGGVESFLHFLLNYPLNGFNEYTRPYENKDRRELIALGMSAEQRFYTLWRSDDLPLPYAACRACDLYRAFTLWCKTNGERYIPTSTAFGTAVGKRERKRKKRAYVFDDRLEKTVGWQGLCYLIEKKTDGAEVEIEAEEDEVARLSRDCQAFQKALDAMIGEGKSNG